MNLTTENLGNHAKTALKVLLSGAILSAFLLASHLLSDYFSLSFPPALSAMLALFAALQLKLIKLAWLTPSANPLLNYMPLFFVPAAAKVVEHSAIISHYWLVLLLCLVIVPACGLLCIGAIMQSLGKSS